MSRTWDGTSLHSAPCPSATSTATGAWTQATCLYRDCRVMLCLPLGARDMMISASSAHGEPFSCLLNCVAPCRVAVSEWCRNGRWQNMYSYGLDCSRKIWCLASIQHSILHTQTTIPPNQGAMLIKRANRRYCSAQSSWWAALLL
jgi:hypothetical protein